MTKIFVRERRRVGKGARRPRFAVVAVQGTDLRLYRTRVRRAELEKIAADSGAEIVWLPRGEKAAEEKTHRTPRHPRHHKECEEAE